MKAYVTSLYAAGDDVCVKRRNPFASTPLTEDRTE
jgi:hypothetical protein